MKHYDINNEKIVVARCKTCGHQVDISNIQGGIEINGLDEIESTSLVMIDSLMINALNPCCDEPDYEYDN